MKYYIIAGEASGDLHASNLIKALKQQDSKSEFRVWGGDLMQEAGGDLVKHYRDLAFMGFLEVLKNIRTILRNIRFCKEDIRRFQPDVLIFVDYPGFNLRIAEWAKKEAYRTFYYISPQIWAWHTSRVHKIKKIVERMFVILPFEKAFYEKYDVEVDFVGHPLLDVTHSYPLRKDFRIHHALNDRPIIALLPGSRKQEISRMLPEMLSVFPLFSGYQFVVAGAPSIEPDFYENIIANSVKKRKGEVKVIHHQTYSLLKHAYAALVTSGTATLETALFDVPQVVCYKGNFLSYLIARRLIKVNYISLVNLIAEKSIVKELIQQEMNTQNLKEELQKLLDEKNREQIKKEYSQLKETLGQSGASQRTAELMVAYLS
ncbi:MAG: lipid-A-disaccharide synthase [Bacteroidetes bacterium]|nr:lipid-A-disaccharide synthase [Bacteroidota bacterium]